MVSRPAVPPEVRSPRLLLRPWRDDDLPAFAALNADPDVMEFFPSVLSPAESDAAATRIRQHSHDHGFGLWAVELPGIAPFIGFRGRSRRVMQRLGMQHAAADDFDHPKIPEGHALRCHVVYRLSRSAWQQEPR